MMKGIQNKIIIWAADDFNSLGLLRELGNKDLDVFFLIRGRKKFAYASVYCKGYMETNTIEDGYKYLLQNYRNEINKPILLTSGDGIITYIDEHRSELSAFFILSGTKEQGILQKYIDKNNMTSLAREIGILCPISRFVQWNTDVSDVCFPCLIKPSHEKPGHYNEFKFKICKNLKELKSVLKLVRKDSEFILQQYIPKELDLLVYGARMFDQKTIIAGAMIRDRWADSGSSSHGYFTRHIPGANVDHIVEFLNRIDYYGPFSFEYGLVGDKAYFFEVNLRNDGTSHYFYQAGANIPLAYVYSCAGIDYSHICTVVEENRWFIDEIFDIENVLKRNISYKLWKKDMSNATIYKYYSHEDTEPWEIVKRSKWKQIFQDIILKRFRVYIVFIMDKLGIRK